MTVYLDHAASTPLRAEVREAMEPYFSQTFANPSGVHRGAKAARRAIDDAREAMAAVLSCEPSEVIFTSGGTEADNLAVTGTALRAVAEGGSPLVCCSAVEHPAVREPVRFLGGLELPVDAAGVLSLDALASVIGEAGDRIALVSVMAANNETGVVQPLEDVAGLVHALAPDALVHTDAVQAFCWLDIAERAAGADLVSVTAHKFGGPKGSGALVARGGARRRLAPLLRGGPQERELRAGTPNVPGIVGLAAAAELAHREREAASTRARELSGRLLDGIAAAVPGARLASAEAERLPSIVNVGLPGLSSEEVLVLLDELGVAASAGSACASGALEPSPVLTAMGLSPAEARTHVRFSLGPSTTGEEIDAAVHALAETAARLAPSR